MAAMVNIVTTGSIANIHLSSGSEFLTLRVTSDLGIVEQVTGGKDVKLYRLTEMGKEIIISIKNR